MTVAAQNPITAKMRTGVCRRLHRSLVSAGDAAVMDLNVVAWAGTLYCDSIKARARSKPATTATFVSYWFYLDLISVDEVRVTKHIRCLPCVLMSLLPRG
jgi:hypothetical protein